MYNREQDSTGIFQHILMDILAVLDQKGSFSNSLTFNELCIHSSYKSRGQRNKS
jgi:hypothetical protein